MKEDVRPAGAPAPATEAVPGRGNAGEIQALRGWRIPALVIADRRPYEARRLTAAAEHR